MWRLGVTEIYPYNAWQFFVGASMLALDVDYRSI